MPNPKKIARFILDTHMWNPAKAFFLLKHYFHKHEISQKDHQTHILAALNWLKRAQDATRDGGVAGRYLLTKGWTDSYPETSGYIIPTLLEAGSRYEDSDCKDRVRKIVDFLLSVQMENGAFPGGEYNPKIKTYPIVFNTGQIILGLIAWYNKTADPNVADSVKRAADWLVEVQEEDGSWQKDTYGNLKTAYHSRVAWPLALCGKVLLQDGYVQSASRFVDWVLAGANRESGWIDYMGFGQEDYRLNRSVAHTLAYTYRGLLEFALLTDRQDIIELVVRANDNLIKLFQSGNFMPGIIYSDWRGTNDFTCLTGDCQLSIIWLKLYQLSGDRKYLASAEKLLTQVMSWQSVKNTSGGIRGGICGSGPIWGEYIRFGLPNWAAKFFLDAMMLLQHIQDQTAENDDGERG